MDPVWLLKGEYDAPGWRNLERDSKADEVDLLHFDRLAWALVRAADPPDHYEGLEPSRPADGLYVDGQGRPVYLVDCRTVAGPFDVIAALGEEAVSMLEDLGDPDLVLERMGRAF